MSTLNIGQQDPKELIEKLTILIRSASQLMDSIPQSALAEALMEDKAADSVARMLKRRSMWNEVFHGIAEDVERQYNSLVKSRQEAKECLTLAEHSMRVLNSKDFEKTIVNLGMYAGLLKSIKELHEDGNLNKILESLNQHEVFTTPGSSGPGAAA